MRRKTMVTGYACSWLVLIAAVEVCADPGGSPASLNLDQAVYRALENNPGLVANGYRIEAQQGLVTQAGLRPYPELSALVENAAGSGVYRGLDAAEATLSVSWYLERGKREARVGVARAGMALLEAEADSMRMDVAVTTASMYLDTLALQERTKGISQFVAIAEQTLAEIGRRVTAGRAARAEQAIAEADLARARLEYLNTEHELAAGKRRLAAQWGQLEPDFERVGGDLSMLPDAVVFDAVLQGLDNNPDLARYTFEREFRQAELGLAEKHASPDWRVTAGVRRMELTGDQALLAGITVPLTRSNRNQGNIARASAEVQRSGAERDALRLQLESRLLALHQELQHSLHTAEVIGQEIIPMAERALHETRSAYEAGRYGYAQLKVVQAELIDARLSLIGAQLDAHKYHIEIERLTGAPIAGDVTQMRDKP